MIPDTTSAVVFFDGPCVLCQRSVQWMALRRADVPAKPEFASCRATWPSAVAGPFAHRRCRAWWFGRADVRVAADALRALAPFLTAPGRGCAVRAGWGYAWVARNRTAWFGMQESCTWSPEVQARLAEPGQAQIRPMRRLASWDVPAWGGY